MSAKIIKGTGGDFFDPTLLEIGQGRTVVPRELILASEEARLFLEKARDEAVQIRERARQVLEAAIQEKEEERQLGFEEGHQEGLAQLTERMTVFELERERLLIGQEEEILQMVLEIARKVVARELNQGAVADIVRQAIAQAIGEKLVVKLHPDDLKKILRKKDFKGLTLIADETITPGGCLVETELGSVDARFETQWKAIQKALEIK